MVNSDRDYSAVASQPPH